MEGKNLKRQSCEVYSRVVGYLRPVDNWNPGKQSEFGDRKSFAVAEKCAVSAAVAPEAVKVAA